jgi:hypothetical protein
MSATVATPLSAIIKTPESNPSSDPKQEESYIQSISQQKLKLSSGEQILSEKHFLKMVARAINPDFFGIRIFFIKLN